MDLARMKKSLIEMGVMTEDEVKKKYGMPKGKKRWRQIKKEISRWDRQGTGRKKK